MDYTDKYDIVIGLEVHAQLLTKSKLFCGDSITFGQEPNTHISPITLGHPGVLPKMNKKAIEYAIKMGLACNCEIEQHNYFARKNYFYPDLPKGYQISQHTTPICKNGYITIKTNGVDKNIRLNRIHLEEDAGKSIHDVDPLHTCVDYNRAGTPLIEIVTEPDISSADEAFAYLTELRKLVRYLDVCDGNMEEGSLRCDVNISVKPKGSTVLGTRVEVKNLNSIRNAKKAVEYEAQRLMNMVENGEKVVQQTRSFDANNGTTFSIRDKEDADDYRYFADPDLTPFHLTDDFINSVKAGLPALQHQRIERYTANWQLSQYDAQQLTEEKEIADYYEAVVAVNPAYKSTANWLLGPVKAWLNDKGVTIADFPLSAAILAGIIQLVDKGSISFSAAQNKLLPYLADNPGDLPEIAAQQLNLLQQSNQNELEPVIEEVLNKLDAKVKEYQKGKKGLLALFVGEVMKATKGKADPKLTNEIILKKIAER